MTAHRMIPNPLDGEPVENGGRKTIWGTERQCAACGVAFIRVGRKAMQKYCGQCSERKDLQRKGLVENRREAHRAAQLIGSQASTAASRSIGWTRPTPTLEWSVRIAVPFSYAASKNHIYAMSRRGHVRLRAESASLKSVITAKLSAALISQSVKHNKVWIDILVQKSNHKGDAINVLDLVCDGIKKALPVDDRWFCIRSLDWEIVREGGQIYIGIGQEDVPDAQVCSYCGQIKHLDAFTKKKGGPMGHGRECKPCVSAARAARKSYNTTRIAA